MRDESRVTDGGRLGQTIRETLPLHQSDQVPSGPYRLRVDGLVRRCLNLTPQDLERFPQHDLTDDFSCLEGWTVPNVRWSGVLLDAVLLVADPLPDAQYIQASAGDFSLPLSREDARRAVLATRLGGDVVPAEHGGPVRLVVPGGQCFMQIKWLTHLELRRDSGTNTAKATALGRLSSPTGFRG